MYNYLIALLCYVVFLSLIYIFFLVLAKKSKNEFISTLLKKECKIEMVNCLLLLEKRIKDFDKKDIFSNSPMLKNYFYEVSYILDNNPLIYLDNIMIKELANDNEQKIQLCKEFESIPKKHQKACIKLFVEINNLYLTIQAFQKNQRYISIEQKIEKLQADRKKLEKRNKINEKKKLRKQNRLNKFKFETIYLNFLHKIVNLFNDNDVHMINSSDLKKPLENQDFRIYALT